MIEIRECGSEVAAVDLLLEEEAAFPEIAVYARPLFRDDHGIEVGVPVQITERPAVDAFVDKTNPRLLGRVDKAPGAIVPVQGDGAIASFMGSWPVNTRSMSPSES